MTDSVAPPQVEIESMRLVVTVAQGRADAAGSAGTAPGEAPRPGSATAGSHSGPQGELRAICDRAAGLFVAWQEGREDAMEALVRLLTPLLWHTVRAYRLDQASAEDVVQGTWLALVRTQANLEDPQAVVRWLTVTARREAWRVSRRSQRQQPAEEEIIQANAGVTPGPEELVVRDHRDQALWDAVRSLPERCQRLLRVVAFADRPDYEQLSRDLGMPVGSIGPTRGRCLGKLRAALAAHGDWRTT